MRLTGAQIVVRALEHEGVRLAFGIPGTHNIELYDALAQSKTVRPVLVTDEQSAGFMADAAWRASGVLACVNIVPGAGLTHALSGIAEAFMDCIPMLVLGCGIRRDTGRAFQLHDVDQLAMVAPVTKAAFRPASGSEIYATIRRACRIARDGAPGPVMVEIPADQYLFKHDARLDDDHDPLRAVTSANAEELDRVRILLNRAERPLLYVGLGAAGAREDLVRLAERLEAPVATTFQGKGVFPESHPLALWPGFGDAAPPFVRAIAAEGDVTLAIGCRFGEVATGSYGLRPPGPLIHVDIDQGVIGRNYETRIAVRSDGGEFVRAIVERISPRSRDDPLRERIRDGLADVKNGWRAAASGTRVSPYVMIEALQARFGQDAIFTTDSGNGTFIAMEALRLDAAGHFLAPVDYSCMGYSVPAAIGAKLARPASPVIALAGDGAFLMTGMELLTAAHNGVAVAVFVLRDRELAQIAQFQRTALNTSTCSVLPDYNLAALSAGLGVECIVLNNDAELDGVLSTVADVTAAGRPIVVDVAVDYSTKTFFTKGVIKTNLNRLPWPDRLRFVGRALSRKAFGNEQ
ncbi:MAG: thiamine pyrophosphate-binding protein [Gemmatimonadaceae bacterium]